MHLAPWLNAAWMRRSRPELRHFLAATRQVASTQRRLLLETLRRNSRSEFGQSHRFDSIRDVREFQGRVPIARYEDLAPRIDRIAAGVPAVLTEEPVEILEPTSGSTAGRRLIPYTKTLRTQFQRAIAAWIADLFAARPAVRRGRAYWSITPPLGRPERTTGGLRIGFADDAEYLGIWERFFARRLMAVPTRAIHRQPSADFRYLTLLHLLAAEDLALVSVWSPTFLSTLIRPLGQWSARLAKDLRRVAPAGRAAQVAAILADEAAAPVEKLARLWPGLALISCWADASAATFVPEIRRLFPGVEIQPKGLLSTECCVSFPLVGRSGSALAIRSHFFEFADESTAATNLAHELEIGRTYRVIATTGGGLYRYDTGDWVEVVGTEGQCPLLRFVGRNQTCDLAGEKLGEVFVQKTIARLFADSAAQPCFATLVPCGHPPQYHLLLQFYRDVDPVPLSTWEARLQEYLSENPYYRHAVEIGQLQPARVQVFDRQKVDLWDEYERACKDRQIKAGDVKPRFLDPLTNWSKILADDTETTT